jgi:hypothetical protein
MPVASPRTVAVAASTPAVYCGRFAPAAPPVFSSVTQLSTGTGAPFTDLGQTLILNFHGSGNDLTALAESRHMQATLNPDNAWGAYLGDTTFVWKELNGGIQPDGNRSINVWPNDKQPNNGANRRESDWCGWTDGPDSGKLRLYTERRLDAMLARLLAEPRFSATKRVLTGQSMGGWGTMSYGIRRAHIFPAIYANMPRWRYSQITGQVSVRSWTVAIVPTYPVASAPLLVPEDGGYSVATHFDHIAYVANAANVVPWIGWTVGKNDGYMPWQDHVDAVAALRATGRGFAFTWNLGNHGGQPSIETIFASYTRGMFELGKGYPIFSEHSLDSDPATADSGGINMGLGFRNVTESAGSWSCQVRHISSACTVKVSPYSTIYTGDKTAKTVTIPAANTWVTVTFP